MKQNIGAACSAKPCRNFKKQLRPLWTEAHELTLIFAKIIRTTDTNLKTESFRAKS